MIGPWYLSQVLFIVIPHSIVCVLNVEHVQNLSSKLVVHTHQEIGDIVTVLENQDSIAYGYLIESTTDIKLGS
jgi:hypothetical protein